MIDINVRPMVKAVERQLSALAYRQMPFATAQALTSLAKIVKEAEKEALPSIFDRPTPFTVNSIGVIPARKDTLQATVFVKDIAAAYLAPYEFGGKNKLNAKALLKPVQQPVNQYGNLPRSKIRQLTARADVFVGKVKGKSGQEINGVWQRVKASKGQPASLKLLVAFDEPHEATQHIDYRKRAEALIRANFDREMGKALARAVASAR